MSISHFTTLTSGTIKSLHFSSNLTKAVSCWAGKGVITQHETLVQLVCHCSNALNSKLSLLMCDSLKLQEKQQQKQKKENWKSQGEMLDIVITLFGLTFVYYTTQRMQQRMTYM